ncbi:MAG: substrate-binding domain-containing protein [Spirochaetaceae bacterium]|jgi:D-xylose transport system substrate-binding protein|nr:substrate-binding domain-containing protein [Spirochaetaceae bacterium]
MKWIGFVAVGLMCLACFNGQKPSEARSGPDGRARRNNAPRDGAESPGGVTIGFSVATDTFIIERWNKDIQVFSGAAQALGAKVLVQLSAGGTKEQIAQINYMVNQKVDVLVVLANDTEVLAGAIKQIRDAGIPVAAYDRMIRGVPLDAYISFDNREVGRLIGRALLQASPRGRYLLVNGSVKDSNSYELNAGVHEILDPQIEAGAIRVEREIWLNEWSFDEALEKIGAIFEETLDFDAVSCANDQIASAVIKLLAERRRAGEVFVAGQDAELLSCQYIVEGLQYMTVYKPIGRLAVRAAELAVAIARKQEYPPDTMLDNRSGALVPSYIEDSVAVYKDNMEVVIRDGFHTYEDVYRNLYSLDEVLGIR